MNRFNSLYAVKVTLDTRRETRMLEMDTETGLVWTQCEPYGYCFNQSDPIFVDRILDLPETFVAALRLSNVAVQGRQGEVHLRPQLRRLRHYQRGPLSLDLAL
ncbi:Aspartic endopeptidase [Sarracenia purpurea var. burkii]